MTHQQLTRRARIYAKAQGHQQSSAGKNWFSMAAKEGQGEAEKTLEVMIYGEIGYWGITAGDFIKAFNAIDDGKSPVVVAINSPGGDVFDGIALNGWMTRLGERGTARIDSLAASAASVIAVGAHKVVIAPSALMMIHNPWTFAAGSSEDLRKIADDMDKARDSILSAYRRKAPGIDDAELVRMLDEETWLSADEAVAIGLADEVGAAMDVKASRGRTGIFARFKRVPQSLQASEAEPDESETDPDESEAKEQEAAPPDPVQIAAQAARITSACVKAGVPEAAESLILSASLTDEAAVTAAVARVQAIRDLCVIAKLPDMAGTFAKAGLSLEAVRARLFDQIVQASADEIDNKEPPAGDEKPKAKTPNASAIYSSRKKNQPKAANRQPSKGAKQ